MSWQGLCAHDVGKLNSRSDVWLNLIPHFCPLFKSVRKANKRALVNLGPRKLIPKLFERY